MTITVEFAPTKEEIFKKSDEECEDLAKKLRKTGKVYIDPDFPPNQTSLGVLIDSNTGEVRVQKFEVPWLQPKEFIKPHCSRGDCVDEWKVWDDPHPFHVAQGDLGDCWLIAALMAIAHRKGLIEQIIPKRDYTMDCGIVQVRMFVNNEWKVIKTDFHIPQKAYAKIEGSYGHLHVGEVADAFTLLTGCSSKIIEINSETDSDALWEDLIKHNSSGFFLAAATPEIEEGSEEEKKYKEVNIDTHHAYVILGFKEHDGHRLIQLGHGRCIRFTGKWSHLDTFDNEFLENLSLLDREMSNTCIFWMEIEDFQRLFSNYFVGEYREGSTVLKFEETVRRKTEASGNEVELWTNLSLLQTYWHPVPPMSRSIVGVVARTKIEPITVTVNVQYSINYLYFKWMNHLDAWMGRDEIENFIPLESRI